MALRPKVLESWNHRLHAAKITQSVLSYFFALIRQTGKRKSNWLLCMKCVLKTNKQFSVISGSASGFVSIVLDVLIPVIQFIMNHIFLKSIFRNVFIHTDAQNNPKFWSNLQFKTKRDKKQLMWSKFFQNCYSELCTLI